jgi:hypothetical protein
VAAEHVTGGTADVSARKRYRLLNDQDLRSAVIAAAAARFGYQVRQVRLRLYAGKFAAQAQRMHEQRIRDWCASQIAGGGQYCDLGSLPLCVALARSTTVSCGVQIRYYMRVYQNAAGCRPSTCPALFRGRPPRPSVPGWPQSRRQVRLCAGLQAAASALCAVVAHGV